MMRLACAFLSFLSAGAAWAQEPFEQVRQPALPGWEQVVRQTGGANSIEQWVPRGETVLRWTRMVTVQRFGGLGRRISPADYVNAIGRAVYARCPGARIGRTTAWVLSTYPMAQMWAHCPRDRVTNRPESFMVRAMGGYSDLYAVQVALAPGRRRHEFAFAQRHLEGVILCGPTSREAGCAERGQQR